MPDGDLWLLIGNSRWHWAEADANLQPVADAACALAQPSLHFLHRPPPAGPVAPPLAWAAVGPVPPRAALTPATRLQLADVPLAGAPAWLGIDRALAGWRAASEAAGPVLVADAGTVLSLTRVDGRGRFAGGRLMAGAGLQLTAMGAGTEALPSLTDGLSAAGMGEMWPLTTAAAMARGVAEGLTATVLEAARQAWDLEPDCRIVLTGGDGPALLPLLRRYGALGGDVLLHRPDLCLQALVDLRPGPWVDRVQARPRSWRI